MDQTIYANVDSSEGTANTSEASINLPWFSRRLVLTNDGSNPIKFFLKDNATSYITLKGSETVTIDRFRTNQIKVQTTTGTSDYRIWAFG